MAQHVTTLNEIRQDTVEHEYALDPNDLLYVCHGSGSDRDRVFKIQDVYDGSKEFELLGYGSTSQQIALGCTIAGAHQPQIIASMATRNNEA